MITALGRVLGDVLGDTTHDASVRLDEVHAAHAGLAGQTCRNHDDVRACGRLVAGAGGWVGGGPHDLGLEALDGPRLVDVQRQALGLAVDDVGEDHGVEDVVLGEALSSGRPVETRSDHCDLAAAALVLAHDDPHRSVRGDNETSVSRLPIGR